MKTKEELEIEIQNKKEEIERLKSSYSFIITEENCPLDVEEADSELGELLSALEALDE